MKRFVCGCVAVILLVAVPSMAGTGTDLKRKSEEFRFAYIMGVHDSVTGTSNDFLCIPEGVTSNQVFEVVDKFFSDHPEELHLQAVTLIIKALHTVWPCK
jgi:hypothetical protein